MSITTLKIQERPTWKPNEEETGMEVDYEEGRQRAVESIKKTMKVLFVKWTTNTPESDLKTVKQVKHTHTRKIFHYI